MLHYCQVRNDGALDCFENDPLTNARPVAIW